MSDQLQPTLRALAREAVQVTACQDKTGLLHNEPKAAGEPVQCERARSQDPARLLLELVDNTRWTTSERVWIPFTVLYEYVRDQPTPLAVVRARTRQALNLPPAPGHLAQRTCRTPTC
jgi:hypothetical protein